MSAHKEQAAKPKAATAKGSPTRAERAAAREDAKAAEREAEQEAEEAEAAEEAPKRKKLILTRKRADLDKEPRRSFRQGYLDKEPKMKGKKKKARKVQVRATE